MFRVSVIIEVGRANHRHNALTRESWARVKALVKKRDGAICQYCGEDAPDGEADHVLPLAKGGSDRLDNLVWSCQTCNRSKGVSSVRQMVKRAQRGTTDEYSTEGLRPATAKQVKKWDPVLTALWEEAEEAELWDDEADDDD